MNTTTRKLVEAEHTKVCNEIATLTGQVQQKTAELDELKQRLAALKERRADLTETLNGSN